MEVNKDEAERCIEIAEKFMREGNREKAEKFLHKAERLFSTQKAKDLLLQTQFMAMKPPGADEVRKRNVSHQKEEGVKKEPFTQEQVDAVKKIKNCKDYYQILGVTKEASDAEIKKAYKKLALQFHPDKNKAPGAAEAFKSISKAMSVLMDVEKRKHYDLYGPDDERVTTRTRQRTRTYFEADESDELFRMFFGQAFTGTNVYYTSGGRWHKHTTGRTNEPRQQQAEQNNYSAFVQLLPILIVILLSMASSLFVSDPPYSLQLNAKYPVKRVTQNMGIPYYVKDTFHSEYQGSVRRLEMTVEDDYLANLRHSCYREKAYRDQMIWRARDFNDAASYQKAHDLKMPSCEKLKNFS